MNLGVFDIYFATAVGMAMHPGYSKDNVKQPTLADCAVIAAEMIELRDKYVQEETE